MPTTEERRYLFPPIQQISSMGRSEKNIEAKQNVMRLSKIVKSNIEKERGPSYDNKNVSSEGHDAEYNFDESEDEVVDDSAKEESDYEETIEENSGK